MGGLLSSVASVLSVENCNCGSSASVDIAVLERGVEDLRDGIASLKETVSSIREDTGQLDAKIADLDSTTESLDNTVSSLFRMVIDRLLPGYVTPVPPNTPRPRSLSDV